MGHIDNIVSQLNDLPSSRATFLAILNLYNNPNADIDDLEKIVKNDVSLTAKVLKLVNSSFYGLRRQIANIEVAVRLLGIGTVKSIVLATTVFDFVGFEHLINKNGLWIHSWMVGYLSRSLAGIFSYKDIDTLFIAGLMHDIGKLILSKYLPVEYKLILARLDSEDIDEIALEQECVSFTHSYLGAKVLRAWRFPEKVAYIVEHHHNIDYDNIDDIGLKIVSISNYLANKYGYTFMKNKNYKKAVDITKILNMNEEKIGSIMDMCKNSIPKFV